MRNLFILACALLVLSFAGCDKSANTRDQDVYAVTEVADSNMVKLSGFIHNRNKYPNTKDVQIEIPDLSGSFFRIKTPIEENGAFHFKFKLNQAQDVYMKPYADFLYVYPNDSLHIEIDFDDLNEVKLSGGKSATINRQLEHYLKSTFYRKSDYLVGTNNEVNCSFQEIRKLLDDKKALFYDRRNTFLQTAQIDDDVLFLTEAMIELDYYSALLRVVSLRDHYGNRIIDPAILIDEINRKAIRYFSKNMYADSHFNFIGSYGSLYSLISPRSEGYSIVSYLNQLSLPNDTIKDFIFTHQASIALKLKDTDVFEELYSQISHPYLNSRLMKEYEIALEKINNPEAISASLTGDTPDRMDNNLSKSNLLSEVIAQNKGKVQFINIWTTWCGPCIAELPSLKLLTDEYKDKEVTFFFLCAGKDEKQSHNLLREHGLYEHPRHFCTKEEFSFLSKTFSPICFPYGILVNKNGVIVDYGRYLRPATIRKKIDTLLKQDKLGKSTL